jgi:large subunit ribosomal protein L10
MRKEQKGHIIDDLQETMDKSTSAVLTNYQGITGIELTALRKKLREQDIHYRVVKNTLARFAADRASKKFLTESLRGQVAIAFGLGDVSAPAKAVKEYIKSTDSKLAIKGGFLGDRLLSVDEVETLVDLPSREILLAIALAGMKAPISRLAMILNSPLSGLANVLEARKKQLEGK